MTELPPAIPGWQPPVRTVYPKALVRILSAIITVMTGIASPFTGIIAITMFFAILGGTHYQGGTTGIALFAAFAATPLIAISHLLVTIGAAPLRIARLIWVATCIYLPLVWLAIIFGSIHGHTESNGTGSWTPLIIYVLTTSAFVAVGMISVFRQSSTPDSLPLYPNQP
jgi:hypothetical protein